MMSTPLLYGSISEVFAERSGVMVTAIEGIFLIGAWAGFAGAYLSGSLLIGILCAILAGILIAALYGWITIYLKQHQVVTGTAINILMLGFCSFFQRVIFGTPTTPLTVKPMPVITIPFLSQIPWIGPLFFTQNILTYLMYFIVPISYFILYKTSIGLTIRSTGENPEAVDVAGINVEKIRFSMVLIAGVIGFVASATLTIEKIEMLKNPAYVPTCSINPVLSCGSVMVTHQASVFGFPNPLMGIAGFAVVIVSGVLAITKVRLPQWYWVGLLIGTVLAAAFVHWLIYQTLYVIGALCPYCMVVWSVTIPLLVVVASIALRPLASNPVAHALYTWRWSIVTLWFTAVILMILVRFWNYWSTLI